MEGRSGFDKGGTEQTSNEGQEQNSGRRSRMRSRLVQGYEREGERSEKHSACPFSVCLVFLIVQF